MGENEKILAEFFKYCYQQAKGDEGRFAIMIFYGLANKETGKKTMERFKHWADTVK